MRSRRKWENNIRLDFKEVECEGVEWIQPAQDIVLKYHTVLFQYFTQL
jgi:hypothetical protein